MASSWFARLGPPPRHVALALRVQLALGGRPQQFLWAFTAFGLLFCWIFVARCEAVTWIEHLCEHREAQGHITTQSETGASENDEIVYAHDYEFQAEDGRSYSAAAFTTGFPLKPGALVHVQYCRSRPERARIEGARARHFGPGALLALLFPLIGGAVLASMIRTGLQFGSLFAHGLAAQAGLMNKRKIQGENAVSWEMTFSFKAADGGEHEVKVTVDNTRPLEDEKTELVLYDRDQPKRAVLVDQLPPYAELDDDGAVVSASPAGALLVSLLPLLTVLGNGAYAIMRLRG